VARSAFVIPGSVRVTLSQGEWVEFKTRLTYGERQALTGSALGRVDLQDAQNLPLDFRKHSVLRLSTWIVGWSLCDEQGRRVDVSDDAIEALDPELADEIVEALDAHVKAQEAEKKAVRIAPAAKPQ